MKELLAEFAREAEAVGAGVHITPSDRVTDTLSRLLGGARSVVVEASLREYADTLRDHGIETVVEEAGGAAAEVLSTADAGVCRALAGVATSGTVLIGPGTGLEGAISMLAPHSIVLIERDLICSDLAAALETARHLIAGPGHRLAFITGPSRTSDIELTPVIGVHGPLRLDLVVIDG